MLGHRPEACYVARQCVDGLEPAVSELLLSVGFVEMSVPVQGGRDGFVPHLLFPVEQDTWNNYQTRSS